MKRIPSSVLVFTVFFVLWPWVVDAWRKWEHVQPRELEITIAPEKNEVIAGETASFTITIRNRTDKTVNLDFATGQRWDLVVFHDDTQIWRWSNGMRWEEIPNSIPIKPGVPEKTVLAWRTVDRNGDPLPQGIYRVEGIVMCSPRALVSNKTAIRLLPPANKIQDTVKVKVGGYFDISVPHIINGTAVSWCIEYDRAENRIAPVERRCDGVNETITFAAKRIGHVVLCLYAHPEHTFVYDSLERRVFRIEIGEYD